jgi:hypothetical protein
MSRTIEWRHDGSRLVIPVTVYPPQTGTTFEGIAGRALIDTGSTTTGVTAKIAQQLGLRSIGKRLVSTIGGEKHIDRYIFRVGFDGQLADNDAPTFPYIVFRCTAALGGLFIWTSRLIAKTFLTYAFALLPVY